MKKILTAFALLVSALLLSSCRGEPGAPGRDGVGVIKSVLITVDQKNWEYSNMDNNNYFMATVNMPEITENVFDKGLVKMYRVYDFNSKNPSQIELPYVRHNEYQINGPEWGFYTETVDYEYGIGKMSIFYTASDFDYEIDETFVPEAMQFRAVVMY